MAGRDPHASFPRLKATVTIAGGGLAGLSLAAGLRLRGIPVEVHEAGGYPRHRVCGEFISGVSPATLDALGIAAVFATALPRCSLAWYREGRLIHRDDLPEPALGISRHRLDALLRDRLLALGGSVHEGARLPREPREGLVWAAGRIPAKSRWVGLKCHFLDLPMDSDLEMHLGGNGYAGLAGVEDGRVNVCGLFQVDRSLRGAGHELLLAYLGEGGNRALARRLAAAHPDPDSFSAVAGFALGRQHAEPGLCVLGDAESMIPPFTGNGMSMAFQAAEIALEPLARWSRGDMEWSACVGTIRTALRRRFRRRLAAAGALHPVLMHGSGLHFVESLGRARILPFRPLLSLVR
jgi:2-polyprenyl-6-methoxyphenol hydroxylase-like FAD-dependent oxidoreductase